MSFLNDQLQDFNAPFWRIDALQKSLVHVLFYLYCLPPKKYILTLIKPISFA
jgi:hypothetical protein